MTKGAALLIRVARWLAGEPRREWVDAMAAEAEILGAADLGWARGCLWAAAKDRIWRERTTLALIVAVPIVAMGVQMLFFFPEVWLLRQGLLPSWAFPVMAIIKPLPLAWLLGRWCAHVALSAAALSFVISALLPGLIFWAEFDAAPWIFFGRDATLYGMPVANGLCVTLALWIGAAKLGSRSRAALG